MAKRAPLVFDAKTSSPPVNLATTEKQANTQTHKQKTVKAREGRQFIAAHVLEEAAYQFKTLALQKKRTTQSMLIEAINDLFAKYGFSRIADE